MWLVRRQRQSDKPLVEVAFLPINRSSSHRLLPLCRCVADPACTAWGYCGDPAGCNNGRQGVCYQFSTSAEWGTHTALSCAPVAGYGGIAPPNSCGTKFLNTTNGTISGGWRV